MILMIVPVRDVLMTSYKVSLRHHSVCDSDLKLSVSHKAFSLLQFLSFDCVYYLHIYIEHKLFIYIYLFYYLLFYYLFYYLYILYIIYINKIRELSEIYLHNVSFSFFRASKYFRLFSFNTY